MVGPEAEREGIIRAGAEMVETMSCATVPKIVAHPQSRQRRRLLRHGRPGLRPQLHLQLAHRAHRRDGRRFRRRGALLRRTRKAQRRQPLPEDLQEADRAHPRRLRALARRPLRRRPRPLRRHHRSRLDIARGTHAWLSKLAMQPPARRSRWPAGSRSARLHDPHRQRPRLLGRLAGSARPPGRAGSHRLPRARLSRRDHHVDPAEAEAGRPESRLRARLPAPDRAHRPADSRAQRSR